MQHINGASYADVLSMPTCERRFFLGLLTKDKQTQQEHMEKMKEEAQVKNGKGQRTTRVSGEALKNKMKSGEIPTK